MELKLAPNFFERAFLHGAMAFLCVGAGLIGYSIGQHFGSAEGKHQAQLEHKAQTLDAVQTQADERDRHAGLQAIFSRLMETAVLTPLFNYQYQISAPPGVNGIRLNTRGWFDFTEAWLPPPNA